MKEKKNTFQGVLAGIFTLWALSAIFMTIDKTSDILDNPVGCIGSLVVIFWGAIAAFAYIAKSKCPACGSRSHDVTKRKSFETGTSTYTETHRITHYSPDGEETGYSEYDEEVPCSTYTTYETHQCKDCSHTWETS